MPASPIVVAIAKQVVADDRGANEGVFVPWEIPPDDALARIEACCDLARDRDVVWFAPPRLLPVVVHEHATMHGFHPCARALRA